MIKKTKKQVKKLRYTVDFIKAIKFTERANFEGEKISKDSQLVLEAQRLHASVYLDRNFITESDLSLDGRIHETADPHQRHATYFIVRNKKTGRIIATSRQIEHNIDKKHLSFPLLEKAEVEQKWINYIMQHSMDNIVEISGLAKQRNASSMAPLYLYRQMWHHSLYKKHDLWIMACDVRLFQRLSILLGDAIIQIGSQTRYKGGDVIPSLVMPKEALHALVTSAIQAKLMKRYLRLLVVEFFLDGLSADMISKSDYKELTKHRDVKN